MPNTYTHRIEGRPAGRPSRSRGKTLAGYAKLYFESIDTDNVDKLVRGAADEVIRCFDECVDNGIDPAEVDISNIVSDCAADCTMMACDALTVIAAYGWGNALTCDCDPEDGPLALFENDVYELAGDVLMGKYDIEL